MKTHRKASIVVLLMAAFGLMFTGFAWTAGGTESDAGTTEEAAIPELKEGELEWMTDTSPITLSVFLDAPQGPFTGWGNDPVTQEITKRTGVTIEIEGASNTEHTQLNAMLASGDLPDFIGRIAPEMRDILWTQEFLEPLNKLSDQYAPRFMEILPADMSKIWGESDGNFYMVPWYYSDVPRIADTKGALLTVGQMAMSNVMYDEMGQPAYETLGDFKNLLLQVKAKYPDLPYYTYTVLDPDGHTSMGQTMNRIYGGQPVKNITPEGTVHMNFRDDAYRKGVQTINDWYRSGLFNRENFTITTSEQFDELATNHLIFAYFGQAFGIYRFDSTETKGKYSAAKIPQEPGYEFRNKNVTTGIGGGGLGITTSATDKRRALYYLQFLVSDEGQYLTYHGIEGEHYTFNEGMPWRTPMVQEIAKDFRRLQEELGIINYNVAWIPSMWIDQQYYYWVNRSLYEYRTDAKWNVPYARNERMNDLIRVPGDSEEKVIETQVMELWKNSLPSMYLAETAAESMQAYDEFIQKAEKLGLAQLEAAYTENHKVWAEKMGQ